MIKDKIRTKLLPLICLFGFLFHGLNVYGQASFVLKSSRNREKIICKKVRGLLVVSAYINNKGPFNLILDTGVGIFLITDPSLKDALQLKQIKKISIGGLGENKDVDAYLTPSISVEIGNTIASDIGAAILDEDVFDLSAYAGIPIHGLIGYEFFRSFITKINYQDGNIVVYKNEKINISKRFQELPILIENNKPFCELSLNIDDKIYPLKLLIDTGAGHSLSLETFNSLAFPIPTKNIEANLGVGLNGDINGFMARCDVLKIGNKKILKPICSFPIVADAANKAIHLNRNGSVGNLVLQKFDLIIDYNNKAIFLKPNIAFKEPFEHDMSGLELFSGGENFRRVFVNRVEPNSPADEIGIEKNDELLSVNFKKVSDLSIEEIIKVFQSGNDKSLFLEFLHQDTVFKKIITLKRRI